MNTAGDGVGAFSFHILINTRSTAIYRSTLIHLFLFTLPSHAPVAGIIRVMLHTDVVCNLFDGTKTR